ncbi:MAG: monovalent cation/H+ antiporter subunit D family protein [Gammaproteobacteria bacterium]|nr:monovalent cation/H+ antiporter subunit D family protein [Gammaproteobacteria bacterium]
MWIPLLPLCAALAVVAARGKPNLRETLSILAGVVLFILVAALAAGIDWQAPPSVLLAEPMPGLTLTLTPEPLGMLFALVASLLWPVTTVYALGYMRAHHEQNQTRFYTAFAVSIAAAMGIALAGNMLTLFVFYEILSVATYPLVTHAGSDKAKRAGRVYLGLLMGTSIGLLLPAMIWTWHLTGTLDFTPGGIFSDDVGEGVLGILLVLYVFGIGKAALMPFHRWLPAAMVAPTPVSALLHAVAVVKAGVFTILKVSVYIFGIDRIAQLAIADWLMALAALTIVLASLIALRQDNFKARLAYSTVSQLSYITLGAMLGIAAGAIGSGMHIAMHAFGKITLFFCAGAVLVTAHKSRISELNGIGRQMPWTMGAFTIGAVSMIGAPPAAGFISKWYLVSGALQTEQLIAITAIVVSTVLNAAYFMPIVYSAYFRPAEQAGEHAGHGEAPLPIVLALCTTAALTVIVFFYPDIPLALVRQMVQP